MLIKYLCVTKNFWRGQLWEADKIYPLDSRLKPPHHFEAMDGSASETKEKALGRYKDELVRYMDIVESDRKKGIAPSRSLERKIEQIRERIQDIEGVKRESDRIELDPDLSQLGEDLGDDDDAELTAGKTETGEPAEVPKSEEPAAPSARSRARTPKSEEPDKK